MKKIKQFLKNLKNNKTGNILIEIPVILAIIGGLTAFSADNLEQIIPEARDVRRSADTHQISTALAFYYDDKGYYPIYISDNKKISWQILTRELEITYIQEMPQDPLFEEGYSYRYWSDGQIAKLYYTSEVDGGEKERWNY